MKEWPQTIAELIAQYLADMRIHHYRPRTVESEGGYLKRFAHWSAQHHLHAPEEVTRSHLQAYQRWVGRQKGKRGQPFSLGYQQQLLDSIKRCLTWAKGAGFLLNNPAATLEPLRRVQHLPLTTLNEAELEQVMAQPDVGNPAGLRDRAMLEVLYATAIRRQELIELKRQDFDHQRGLLYVRQGKGGKERVVPIAQRALRWVRRYEAEGRPLLLLEGDGSEYLFINRFGTHLLNRLKVAHYIKQAVPSKPGACHLIRHSVATLLLERGCDIRLIQEFLGHEDLNTTQRYTQVRPQDLQRMIYQFHPALH